jgi:flagellin
MQPISLGIRGVDQQMLHSFRRNSDRLQTSLERLSTGKRINRPSDDPAGFVAAEGFRRDLTDLQAKLGAIGHDRRASQSAQSGLASLQSALVDLRERVLSAADSLLAPDERATLQDEIASAIDAVNRIGESSGAAASSKIDPSTASALRAADAQAAELMDAKNLGLATQRAKLAAHEHTHLDVFEELFQDQVVITSEALSQAEDTDFAAESTNFVQSQVLAQSAMAALEFATRTRVEQITQLLDERV